MCVCVTSQAIHILRRSQFYPKIVLQVTLEFLGWSLHFAQSLLFFRYFWQKYLVRSEKYLLVTLHYSLAEFGISALCGLEKHNLLSVNEVCYVSAEESGMKACKPSGNLPLFYVSFLIMPSLHPTQFETVILTFIFQDSCPSRFIASYVENFSLSRKVLSRVWMLIDWLEFNVTI